jgi:hypothetical protein
MRPHHLAQLALHHGPRLLDRRPVVPRDLDDLQRVADRCKGIAELVRQRGEELILATVGIAEPLALCVQSGMRIRELEQRIAHLVLSSSSPHRRAQGADERGDANGPFQNGDVAEQRQRRGCHRRVGADANEQDDGNLRPGRLGGSALSRELAIVASGDDFLRQHDRADTLAHVTREGN